MLLPKLITRLLLIGLCFIFYSKTHSQISLTYEEFGVSFSPKKCIDTLNFSLTKQYPGYKLKIFLKDCKGECDFEVYDKKSKLRITGSYVNAIDTLSKYKGAVIRGLPRNIRKSRIRLIKYMVPFEKGTWTYYDENGKITDRFDIDFIYERS